MILLDVEDLLHVAERVVPAMEVRDVGLFQAAAARPRPSACGEGAYPSLHQRAAALLHSLVRGHALVDGNKPLGLSSVIAFYGMNGVRLTLTNDEAYDLIVAVAAGELDDVPAIAERLASRSEPRT